ncbi:MAG: hypothetical protein EOP08_00590 [Proteobacteria bacterium]|nr:MAG: hypothetical protein EOP08_00590 [Pseudomonadota bacterium]
MNILKTLIVSVLVVAASTAGAADKKTTRQQKNEAILAKMLEGRVAGEPMTCIPGFPTSDSQVIEGVAMVYRFGDTIYVAKPKDPQMLRRDDVMIINRFGGQFCNTDVIRTVDRMSGFLTGVVFLEQFVPYRKPN